MHGCTAGWKEKNSERNWIDIFELNDAEKDAETLTEAQRGGDKQVCRAQAHHLLFNDITNLGERSRSVTLFTPAHVLRLCWTETFHSKKKKKSGYTLPSFPE